MQLCSSFFCLCTPGFDVGHMSKYTVSSIPTVLTLNCRPRHFQSIFPEGETLLTGLSVQPTNYKKIMVDSRLQLKYLGEFCSAL